MEVSQNTDTDNAVEQHDYASVEVTTPTTENTVTNGITVQDQINTEAETQQTGSQSEHTEEKDVLVSPFGYGPYPEVPADFREAKGDPIWEGPGFPDEIALPENAELLARVTIKVWKEGNRDWVGVSYGNGKVWINYPNTLYVWYGEPYEDEDGTIRTPFRKAKGDPNARLSLDEIRLGIVPPGVRILDGESEAIDVFQYLNLSLQQ